MHTPVLIIGGGPAGYTAAIYAARAGLTPIQFLGLTPGGQLMITAEVENYPGFADMIQGPWLMEQMQAQAQKVGTHMVYDMVVSVDFSKRPFTVTSDSGQHYTADSIIIATGAKAKWLEIPSERTFQGHGVSACATCDGFFFKGQDVVVVGGGNSAVEEAIFLAHMARSVTIVHRRDSFRAEKIAQDRLFATPNIKVLWNQVVDEILGEEKPKKVTGLRLQNSLTKEMTEIPTDGVFVAIGHVPETGLFKGMLEMDSVGYITVKHGTRTSVPGVFAAGDVQDTVYRQAVTAAGQGCMAALDADRFLQGLIREDRFFS